MQDIVFLEPMQKRIEIGLFENAALNGDYKLNPFLFCHHNVNFISVYIHGQPIQSKSLVLHFANQNYIRAYHRLFSSFSHIG